MKLQVNKILLVVLAVVMVLSIFVKFAFGAALAALLLGFAGRDFVPDSWIAKLNVQIAKVKGLF